MADASDKPVRAGAPLLGTEPVYRELTEHLFHEAIQARRGIEEILERISDAFVALDTEWCYTYVNDKACRIFNREREEFIGRHIWTEFPEGVGQPFYHAYLRAVETQEPQFIEEYYAPYDRWFENRIYPSPEGLTVFFQDITDRKRSEIEIQRLYRALSGLTACNRALLRATNETELLRSVCRISVDIGGYRMAWVGFAQNDEHKTVRPVAHAGFEEGYLENADVVWSDSERGQGPTGTCIRTGVIQINRDVMQNPAYEPWRESATLHGYRASIALPLVIDDEVIGALNIYATEPDAFDAAEVDLLEQFADDLAYGIASLRARAEAGRISD